MINNHRISVLWAYLLCHRTGLEIFLFFVHFDIYIGFFKKFGFWDHNETVTHFGLIMTAFLGKYVGKHLQNWLFILEFISMIWHPNNEQDILFDIQNYFLSQHWTFAKPVMLYRWRTISINSVIAFYS